MLVTTPPAASSTLQPSGMVWVTATVPAMLAALTVTGVVTTSPSWISPGRATFAPRVGAAPERAQVPYLTGKLKSLPQSS